MSHYIWLRFNKINKKKKNLKMKKKILEENNRIKKICKKNSSDYEYFISKLQ